MSPSRNNNAGWFIFVVALGLISLVLLGILVLIVWQGSQPPESSVMNIASAEVPLTASIPLDSHTLVSMSEGQVTFGPGEASLFIPAGALEQAGQVILTAFQADLFSELGDPGWRRPYMVNIEFKDLGGNLVADPEILKPIEVCFVLDATLWIEYNDQVDFRIERYDESQSPPTWVQLPKYFYENRQQLCGTTQHLSLFALAVNDVLATMPTATPAIYSP